MRFFLFRSAAALVAVCCLLAMLSCAHDQQLVSIMVTVASAGLLSPAGFACGNALVSATVTTNHSAGNLSSSGAIVTGYMTANVACLSSTGPILTVNFLGAGTGNISSAPP